MSKTLMGKGVVKGPMVGCISEGNVVDHITKVCRHMTIGKSLHIEVSDIL
jgi:hypothetical protein